MKRRITSLILALVLTLALCVDNASALRIQIGEVPLQSKGGKNQNTQLKERLEKLSSGFRIYRPLFDNQAPSDISEEWHGWMSYRSLFQNPNDGLRQMKDLIDQIVELAIQSSEEETGGLQPDQEFEALKNGIDLIFNYGVDSAFIGGPTSICGMHPADADGSHEKAPCDAHYACEPGDHYTIATCGVHYICVHGDNMNCLSDADGASLVSGGMVNTNADNDMAPCGMHPANAAGKHDRATCDAHYACEPGDHDNMGSCTEHFACAPGDHNNMAACTKHLACAPGDHDNRATCGIHRACAPGDHDNRATCDIHRACAPGNHDKAPCDAHYACEPGDHDKAPCDAHYACASGDHDKAPCDAHYACEPGDHDKAPCDEHNACEPGDHDKAPCDEHYACAPGDHYAIATCGVHHICVHGDNTDCSVEFNTLVSVSVGSANADNDTAPCGMHPADAEGDHNSIAPCGEHPICVHGDNTDCLSDADGVSLVSGGMVNTTAEMATAPCGMHPADAEGDHYWANCFVHYRCEPGDHNSIAPCDAHSVCVHGDNTDCLKNESAGMFIGLLDDGTIFAGIEYSGGVMAVVGEEVPAGNEAGQDDQIPVSGVDFVQYATDGGDIYGSSDPSVAMVTPNGDIAVMGPGSVSLAMFDPQGNSVAVWNMISDGENLDYGPIQAISLDGEPVSSITMQLGGTVQLGVVEIDGESGRLDSPSGGITGSQMQPEDVTARESSIRDTDMADEITAYTKNNILLQAAQSMLTQANAVPQGVLQILQ